MYNIIPLAVILASLAVIIIIVVKKFPILANLDVENIPKEKEARFKEQILSGRLKREIFSRASKIKKIVSPALEEVGKFFQWAHDKLYELKEAYGRQEALPRQEAEKAVDKLLAEANELAKNEELDAAEKKLIEIINLDSKNAEAFKKLGELYFERKNFEEAKQTFEYAAKLEKGSNGEVYFDLALVNMSMGDAKSAAARIKNALELEPNNPRYIDTAIQISIMNKDKAKAVAAYDKLKEVNPDNRKLDEIKSRIDEM